MNSFRLLLNLCRSLLQKLSFKLSQSEVETNTASSTQLAVISINKQNQGDIDATRSQPILANSSRVQVAGKASAQPLSAAIAGSGMPEWSGRSIERTGCYEGGKW
uniref:Bm10005 n=1 Tax=Brugia malayi TaxID=6279 RepID=A0A1I9G2J5_BRUMA|nr:Bm10005 [Brugia malayi]